MSFLLNRKAVKLCQSMIAKTYKYILSSKLFANVNFCLEVILKRSNGVSCFVSITNPKLYESKKSSQGAACSVSFAFLVYFTYGQKKGPPVGSPNYNYEESLSL